MSANMGERLELQRELRSKVVCRFCLTANVTTLDSIFMQDTAGFRSTKPLPIQIMSCASMEVFLNDGLPSWICLDCRKLFEYFYRFKDMCKQAETLLRQFPLTGQWPNPLEKPNIPRQSHLVRHVQSEQKLDASRPVVVTLTNEQNQNTNLRDPQFQRDPQKIQQMRTSSGTVTFNLARSEAPKNAPNSETPKKVRILNSTPADKPEPPIPVRMQQMKPKNEDIKILAKFENDEIISMDDLQRLVAVTDDDDCIVVETKTQSEPIPQKEKPKLLNKWPNRILNKDAERMSEPVFSVPKVERDEDGTLALVTEILTPSSHLETDEIIKNADPVETNIFPCSRCERTFPLEQLRDMHMQIHERERSFACEECNSKFFSKYDLQKHMLRHTGEKPFQCALCNQSFNRQALLQRHQRYHTEVPKFICVHCEKAFISQEELEKHAAKHNRYRPFKCKLCPKSFAFKQGLERHEAIHSRNQPHECQYCDMGFSTPRKLAQHLTAHAGTRPYPCRICSKSYLLSHHLSRHMRTHKRDDQQQQHQPREGVEHFIENYMNDIDSNEDDHNADYSSTKREDTKIEEIHDDLNDLPIYLDLAENPIIVSEITFPRSEGNLLQPKISAVNNKSTSDIELKLKTHADKTSPIKVEKYSNNKAQTSLLKINRDSTEKLYPKLDRIENKTVTGSPTRESSESKSKTTNSISKVLDALPKSVTVHKMSALPRKQVQESKAPIQQQSAPKSLPPQLGTLKQSKQDQSSTLVPASSSNMPKQPKPPVLKQQQLPTMLKPSPTNVPKPSKLSSTQQQKSAASISAESSSNPKQSKLSSTQQQKSAASISAESSNTPKQSKLSSPQQQQKRAESISAESLSNPKQSKLLSTQQQQQQKSAASISADPSIFSKQSKQSKQATKQSVKVEIPSPTRTTRATTKRAIDLQTPENQNKKSSLLVVNEALLDETNDDIADISNAATSQKITTVTTDKNKKKVITKREAELLKKEGKMRMKDGKYYLIQKRTS